MPKAKKKKSSSFQKTITKSVFLYGQPNKEKLITLQQMQRSYTDLINRDIELLEKESSVLLQLVKNDKNDPDMRKLEKKLRPEGINSAICQNAIDAAVVCLSNRLDSIRLDLLSEGMDLFARSKVLFAMSIMRCSKTEMEDRMNAIGKAFHKECAEKLHQMSEKEFSYLQMEFQEGYASKSLEYRVPKLHSVSVPLDSRLMKIEPSTDTKMPYVITITNPLKARQRMVVPINTSSHSLHKIKSNQMAGTILMQIRKGKLRIGWSYESSRKQPVTTKAVGVDTGISDCFHTSDGKAIGSMKSILDFYHGEVEPSFAKLSELRNKKRKISHFVRKHKLPEDVRCSLIKKMDRLEHMIRTAKAPYRKKRCYYEQLDHEIKKSVTSYIDSITSDTLTVIEKLDIKEFDKSRRVNGMFSTFARGKLQAKLMEKMNQRGYDFLEVEPDFTSQVCPICSNLTSENRHEKKFCCTACGYQDDADHVGAVNIKKRAEDEELQELCEKYKYNHKNLQNAIKIVYSKRHVAYQKEQAASA